MARRVEMALSHQFRHRFRLEIGFVKATVDDINNQWHLQNSMTYDLRQVIHHRIRECDPYFEGSNLPDLLGLRLNGRYTRDHVKQHLPRVTKEMLVELFGLSRLEPADGPLEWIVGPSAATLCRPAETLEGRSAAVISARRAVIEVIGKRLTTTQIASLLRIDRTTVNRLRRFRPSATHVQAVRLQLGLWRALGG